LSPGPKPPSRGVLHHVVTDGFFPSPCQRTSPTLACSVVPSCVFFPDTGFHSARAAPPPRLPFLDCIFTLFSINPISPPSWFTPFSGSLSRPGNVSHPPQQGRIIFPFLLSLFEPSLFPPDLGLSADVFISKFLHYLTFSASSGTYLTLQLFFFPSLGYPLLLFLLPFFGFPF